MFLNQRTKRRKYVFRARIWLQTIDIRVPMHRFLCTKPKEMEFERELPSLVTSARFRTFVGPNIQRTRARSSLSVGNSFRRFLILNRALLRECCVALEETIRRARVWITTVISDSIAKNAFACFKIDTSSRASRIFSNTSLLLERQWANFGLRRQRLPALQVASIRYRVAKGRISCQLVRDSPFRSLHSNEPCGS